MSRKPILARDFTYKVTTKGLNTPVAEYTVPRGYVTIFHNDINFGMLLPGIAYDVASAAEDSANEIVVVCPGIVHPNGYTKDADANVKVYLNGAIQSGSDYVLDEDAETLTLTVTLAAGDNVDVFYFCSGQVSIRRISPQELDAVYDTLFSMDLKTVNEVNQESNKYAITRLEKRAVLPEMFKFGIYVDNDDVVCGWTIATAGGAGED
ncbi:unnamed protein product, partial [marine sediment metagenome]